MHTLYLRRPLQTAFRITTDCGRAASLLRQEYGSFLSDSPVPPAEKEISVTPKDGGYEIRHGSGVYHSSAVIPVIDNILFDHTEYDPGYLALHGAAVEWKGHAFLFLAATGSGKSTLTAALTARGFGYLTDDCILLNRQTLEIHPYPAPIHLREGGYGVLTAAGLLDGGAARYAPEADRYVFLPSTALGHSVPLGHIFFLSRSETENSVTPMGANDAVFSLMKSPITKYPVTGEHIRFLARLAGLGCSRLAYRDFACVETLLKSYRKEQET